jgi:hypothetical protein
LNNGRTGFTAWNAALFTSTLLTLIVLPALYGWFDE